MIVAGETTQVISPIATDRTVGLATATPTREVVGAATTMAGAIQPAIPGLHLTPSTQAPAAQWEVEDPQVVEVVAVAVGVAGIPAAEGMEGD